MRRVACISSLIAILVLVSAQAANPERQPLSADQLKAFSEATGLGGFIQYFTSGGHEVAVVLRSFTSGVRTMDLHVYAQKKGSYYLVLSRTTVFGSHLEIRQSGNTLSVVAQPQTEEIMTFTISGCFDAFGK